MNIGDVVKCGIILLIFFIEVEAIFWLTPNSYLEDLVDEYDIPGVSRESAEIRMVLEYKGAMGILLVVLTFASLMVLDEVCSFDDVLVGIMISQVLVLLICTLGFLLSLGLIKIIKVWIDLNRLKLHGGIRIW